MGKMHYQVTLEYGRQVGTFRNMKTGSWYRRVRPASRCDTVVFKCLETGPREKFVDNPWTLDQRRGPYRLVRGLNRA